MCESLLGGALDLCHRRPRFPPLDILPDRAGEENGLLTRHEMGQVKHATQKYATFKILRRDFHARTKSGLYSSASWGVEVKVALSSVASGRK